MTGYKCHSMAEAEAPLIFNASKTGMKKISATEDLISLWAAGTKAGVRGLRPHYRRAESQERVK